MTDTKKDKKTRKTKKIKKTGIHYSCDTCDCNDCKLWRPSHVFANEVKLICWRCLEAKGYKVNYGNPIGIHSSDQVYDPKLGGSWVPAVPDIDGNWWGYSSVPEWWVNWWKYLPNHKDDCLLCRGSGKISEFKCFQCSGTGRRE